MSLAWPKWPKNTSHAKIHFLNKVTTKLVVSRRRMEAHVTRAWFTKREMIGNES